MPALTRVAGWRLVLLSISDIGGGKVDYYDPAMDDAALVRAACEGDKQAFADIYDRYSDRIFSFLCTVVRNREDAADLLQDTFVTAAARLGQLRDPDKLRPWLYAVARHLAMKSLKRTSKQGPLADDFELADPSAGPTEMAAKSELAVLIQEAAEGLGPQDRVVLDLHLRQGLEGQELADALGVTAGHSYVMLSRMKDQVERSLGALLVARQGSKDCRKLGALLEPWDGRLSATWRKRVARHVDGCDICRELRQRILSPAAMLGLGVVPLIAAPAAARESVLGRIQLVGSSSEASSAPESTSGERWASRYQGFPPPIENRRRRAITVAAAVIVLLLLAAVPTVALMNDPEPVVIEQVAGTPKSHPLVFNDQVLTGPSPAASPAPEPQVKTTRQPVATPRPTRTPSASPSPSLTRPAPPASPPPSPVPSQSPSAKPSPAPSPRPSATPSIRPSPPPPSLPGGPGGLTVGGTRGDPGSSGTPTPGRPPG